MNRKELIAAIKSADIVFGFVSITHNDGVYCKLVKADVVQFITNDNVEYNAEFRDGNDLYLN